MNPWPWKRLRDFRGRVRLAAFLKKFGALPTLFAALLSPIGVILQGAGYARWRWVNDNWYVRPLGMGAIGMIGTYALHTSHDGGLLGFYQGVLTGLGDPSTAGASVFAWLALGTFPSLALATPQAFGLALNYEHAHKVWIRPMRRNVVMKVRELVNTRRLRSDSHASDALVFGVHAGDTLPWGDGRRGAIVSRAFKKIGHGFILGQPGSGKTALALNLADQFIHHGCSLVFPDFKGDSQSRASLKASAASAEMPFYTFSFVPLVDDVNVHYDPLGWEGSPTDKAALVMKALPFPAEDSTAAYYRTQAESYLPLQFEALDHVGLLDGEGTFDFLLSTVEPAQLASRLMPLRSDRHDVFTRLTDQIRAYSVKDLAGLKANLAKVVNAGGKYLRPATGDGVNLNIREAIDSGAVIYFELGATLDAVSSVTMGTLLMQDVKAIIGQRARAQDKDYRDAILMSDEASALGVRADIMDDISKQGRSSKIWNWTITQSIVTWPETTRREVVNNATVRIVFNMQEGESQLLLTEGMPMSFYINVRKSFDTAESFLGESAHASGRGGLEEIMEDKQLKPGQIGSLPNRHAWIWISGADDGVKLVSRWARKRTLPWRDEAPGDVLIVKPVLRQRVGEVLAGGPRPKALTGQGSMESDGPMEIMPTPATWIPETLPAPPPIAGQAAPAAMPAPYDGAPEDDGLPAVDSTWGEPFEGEDEQAEPGSVPLSVILKNHRKGTPDPSQEPHPEPEHPMVPPADQERGKGIPAVAEEEVNPLLPAARNPLLPPPAEPAQPDTAEAVANDATEPAQAPSVTPEEPSESWDGSETEPYSWGGENTEVAAKRNPFA